MTSQLRLQHPVKPVVNDYAILLQFHIVGANTRKIYYTCVNTEISFGNQSHQGRHARISVGEWKILHIQLYEYK